MGLLRPPFRPVRERWPTPPRPGAINPGRRSMASLVVSILLLCAVLIAAWMMLHRDPGVPMEVCTIEIGQPGEVLVFIDNVPMWRVPDNTLRPATGVVRGGDGAGDMLPTLASPGRWRVYFAPKGK